MTLEFAVGSVGWVRNATLEPCVQVCPRLVALLGTGGIFEVGLTTVLETMPLLSLCILPLQAHNSRDK